MPLDIGRYRAHALLDGTFALDGGAMFGVVPKTLWQKHLPADDKNRVKLALRCLLLVEQGRGDAGRKILVDCGIGEQWSPRLREIYAIERKGGLEARLAELGLVPEQITDVIVSHLHFDHVGGATLRSPEGALRLAFPRATHHVQRRNWTWAHHPTERDRASYLAETFAALEGSGKLHLIEGDTELLPGVFVTVSEGHTVGCQLVRVEGAGGSGPLVFAADLVPTSAHMRPSWHMAYDLYPLTILEEKRLFLAQALEEKAVLAFAHDPRVAAVRLREDEGDVAIAEVVDL